MTPWTVACQASMSYTISQSLLKFTSTESVMLSKHLILCYLLLLLPSIFPSLSAFSNESALHIRWQSAEASVSVPPMNIQGWFPLGLTDLISLLSKGFWRVSWAPKFESINFLVLCLSYGLTCTSVHDYRKTKNKKTLFNSKINLKYCILHICYILKYYIKNTRKAKIWKHSFYILRIVWL